MSHFSLLSQSQKLLVGGIFGTCIGVFVLNGASDDLQRRRMKAAVKGDGARGDHYQVTDGRLIKQQQPLPNSDSPLAPFLDKTWTAKFVRENLVSSVRNMQEGRYYTLLTSGINHGSISHLGMNMFGLWSMAPLFIRASGSPIFIGTWILTGLAGATATMVQTRFKIRESLRGPYPNKSRAQYLWSQGSLGASASILGLFGALAILFPQTRWQILFIPYGIRAPILLGATLAFSVIADVAGFLPYVGHSAHIGGMMTGTIIGLILKSRLPGGRMLR